MDGFIAGYPKTGNTWFQMIMRKAFIEHFDQPGELLTKIITGDLTRQAIRNIPAGVPRIFITHHMPFYNEETAEEMRIETGLMRGKKVILLIRDARDALVSLYMHNVHRVEVPLYHGTVNEMARNDRYGIDKFVKYYRDFYRDRDMFDGLLLVRYEDMKQDVRAELRRSLEFVGLEDVSDETVEAAVQFGSFDNMKKMEKENALKMTALAPSSHSGENSFKVRKGEVGGFKKHFDRQTIDYIDEKVATLPDFYGY